MPSVLWFLALHACHKSPPAAAVPPAEAPTSTHGWAPAARGAPTERPLLLWEVEKDGAVSHLFGTCHLPIPLEEALPPPHDAALSGARVVVAEVDLGAIDPLEAFEVLDGGGASLREALGPEAWLDLAIRVRGVFPAPMLDRLRPWGAWSVLVLQPAPAAEGRPPVLDQAVLAGAPEAAERRYLETFAEQAEMIGSLDAEFLELLRAGAGDGSAPADAALREACSAGDLSAIEAEIGGPDRDPSMAVMFDVRNARWLEPLVPELARGGAFVAVGAGHMVGPHGLVALLEAQGFAVRRLSGLAPRIELAQPAFRPPLPEVDPAALAAWKESLGGAVPTSACQDGSPIRACYAPDAEVCRAGLARGVELCLEQHADLLGPPRPLTTPDPLTTGVVGCAMAGLSYDLLLSGELVAANACMTQATQAH